MMRPDILTVSGRYFDFLNPDPASITIEAIAHGLANICRFGGHTRQFYSVAQHSVMVANCHVVPESLRFAALMHDAAEAFCGDIPSPLKRLLPDYKVIEKRVEAVIQALFRFEGGWYCIKQADLIMLATEQRDLMPAHDDDWPILAGITPLPCTIEPWAPDVARDIFLNAFRTMAPLSVQHELEAAP